MDRMNRFNAMVAYEQNFETRKWMGEIPHLNFKEHWKVKVIPPFGGAIIRFWIDCEDKHVSVYLDGYDMLGWMEQPYWEIYNGEDTERFLFGEHEQMMARIEELLQ